MLIASAQAPLGSTLVAVALPAISTGLAGDLVLYTGLLVTGYLLVSVVGQAPAGRIGDLVGHPRLLRIGILLYLLGALAGLVAPGVGLLFVSRCAMAAGGALIMPATLALFRIHVPPERRGRIFGLFGATMGIAAAAGPALGGEIVEWFGWRAVFLANIPFLGLSALLLRLFPLPAAAPRPKGTQDATLRRFDLAGTLLFAMSLSLLILASLLDGAMVWAALIVSALAFAAFLGWEAKAADPVFDPALFGSRAFAAGTAITALQNFAMYGLLFLLPQFFSLFREATPSEIGYLLFLMMIGLVLAAPIGGQLTDRIGARRIGIIGALVLLTGVSQLLWLNALQAPEDAFLPLVLFGLGMGLSNAPAQSAAMGAVPPEKAGMAAGVNSTMRYLGSITSIVTMSMVLGDAASVSVARHEIMIQMFVLMIGLSVVASALLPGKWAAEVKIR